MIPDGGVDLFGFSGGQAAFDAKMGGGVCRGGGKMGGWERWEKRFIVHDDFVRTRIARLDANGLPIAVVPDRRIETALVMPPIPARTMRDEDG